MTDSGRRPGRLQLGIVILVVACLALGAGLVFFGVGAKLSQPKVVSVIIQADDVRPVIAVQVKAGDPIYTDVAGMYVGRITAVKAARNEKAVPDAAGNLHAAQDPLHVELNVTIEGPGREGNGIVAMSSQVLQAGSPFSIISDRYMIRGTVLEIHVR